MASTPIIGICGGIGAGKSAVTRSFASLGARVIDADRTAHAVLRLPEIREALQKKFGAGILADDKSVDRARLGQLVFGPLPAATKARHELEAIVHPAVSDLIRSDLRTALEESPPPVAIVLDVPLLLEGPLNDACTHRVFVDAPEPVRHARTAASRGWTSEEHRSREAAQMPLDAKRSQCDVVIENAQGDESIVAQCRHLLAAWSA